MSVENYVVVVENVIIEKQNRMINYLYNETHKNHKNTKIVAEKSANEFLTYLTTLKHKNELNYMQNAKGGKKLKRIAKSFTFNPPKSYNVNADQLAAIQSHLKKSMSEHFKALGIDLDVSNCLFVQHIQENSHIHMILPTLDSNGKNVRYFNAPKFQTELKAIFTNSVDTVLSRNIKSYKSETVKHQGILNDFIRVKDEYEKILPRASDERTKKYFNNQIKIMQRYITELKEGKAILNQMEIEKLNAKIDKVNRANKSNIGHISTKSFK